MRLLSYRQEQSNPESSGDNAGSGGGGSGSGAQKQLAHDKWPAAAGSANSAVGDGSSSKGSGGGGGTAKPYAQKSAKAVDAGKSKGGVVDNSDLEGPCLKNPAKDASATAGAAEALTKGARKSLPVVAPGRSGAASSAVAAGPSGGRPAALEDAAHDHNLPTDMSDTSDSDQEKNLE